MLSCVDLFSNLATSNMSSGELSSARFINSLSSPCSCKIERKQPWKIKTVFFLLLKCGRNINRLQCIKREFMKSEKSTDMYFVLFLNLFDWKNEKLSRLYTFVYKCSLYFNKGKTSVKLTHKSI